MIRHQVRQGESAVTLARRYGVAESDVWNHPDNAELKRLRQTPCVLMPGDELVIPDVPAKEIEVPAGRVHRFRVRRARERLRLRFLSEGEPKAGFRFTLDAGDEHLEGTLDDDGVLDVEVPADADHAELTLEDPDLARKLHEAGGGDPPPEVAAAAHERHAIALHHLDPADERTGVAQRLANLGWDCEPPAPGDTEAAARFAGAVHAFQRAHGLDATGEHDDATRAKIVEIHGV